MRKVYISGKITGLPREKAIEMFETAEERLKKDQETSVLYEGQPIEVVNPFKVDHSKAYAMEAVNRECDEKGTPHLYTEKQIWEQYMEQDIRALMGCKAIHMLTNWVHSLGARIEHAIAKEMGLTITYEQ